MGIPDDARTAAPRSGRAASKRIRRAKIVAAFAVTALVGIGSYAGTYRALVAISTPASGTTSIEPASSDTGATVPPETPPTARR